MSSRIMVKSKEIVEGLVSRSMTATEAAQVLGINYNRFRELLKRDRQVTTKTAGKLVKLFGMRVVYIDDSGTEQSEGTARKKAKVGSKVGNNKRRAQVDSTGADGTTARAEIDTENRSSDDKNPGVGDGT